MGEQTRLFVYGSLQRGMPHERLMAGARFEGMGGTSAAYHLVLHEEGYPALTKSEMPGGGGVGGELYWVSSSHLDILDEFENCPTVYQREPIELCDGETAQAYCIAWQKAQGRERIVRWHPGLASGPWR